MFCSVGGFSDIILTLNLQKKIHSITSALAITLALRAPAWTTTTQASTVSFHTFGRFISFLVPRTTTCYSQTYPRTLFPSNANIHAQYFTLSVTLSLTLTRQRKHWSRLQLQLMLSIQTPFHSFSTLEFLWSTTFSFCSLKLGKRASGFIAFSVAWSLFLSSFLSLRLFLCLPVWQDLYFATRVSISNPILILHSGLIWYPFEVHFTFRFGKPKNENNFSLFVLAAPSQDVFLPTTQHYTIGLGGSILLLH